MNDTFENICDLSNEELIKLKKTIYDAILEDGHVLIYNILREMLDKLCEIERELILRKTYIEL